MGKQSAAELLTRVQQGEERLDLGCVAALGGEMYGGLRARPQRIMAALGENAKGPTSFFFFS